MRDFSKRATGQEIMDNLLIDGADLHQALRELDAINYGLGGNYVTLNGLSQLLKAGAKDVFELADLGCGSGDMLKRIRILLQRRRIDAALTGIDANPHVISFAGSNTPPACHIRYRTLDVFSDEFFRLNFDIITGTLFFHHFTNEQLIHFFSRIKRQVRIGFIINDIHRHWLAYYSIKWLTGLFSRSAMVKNDAPLSVLRGFKKQELKEILHSAGITDYRIKWCWAFRWQVIVPATTAFQGF